MNELIKITTNEQGQRLVSARELYEFLEVKSKYADWIKNRINKYKFIENTDFITLSKILETAQGNKSEYFDHALTVSMAKELSMIQRTDKGKQARQYFITCEGKLNEIDAKVNSLTNFRVLEVQSIYLAYSIATFFVGPKFLLHLFTYF